MIGRRSTASTQRISEGYDAYVSPCQLALMSVGCRKGCFFHTHPVFSIAEHSLINATGLYLVNRLVFSNHGRFRLMPQPGAAVRGIPWDHIGGA